MTEAQMAGVGEDPRRCACGCPEFLPPGARANRHYVGSHRKRAYRRRVEEAAKARGLQGRFTLEGLQVGGPTREPSRDGKRAAISRQAARQRPGVSVYLPSVAVAGLIRDRLDGVAGSLPDGDPAAEGLVDVVARLDAALERKRARGA